MKAGDREVGSREGEAPAEPLPNRMLPSGERRYKGSAGASPSL